MTYLILNSDGVVQNRVIAETSQDSWVLDIKEAPVDIGENYYDCLHKFNRALLLAESDWTQSPDSPLTAAKKAEWATYRQALRDITGQEGYPKTVNWPEQPE